jgi:hypothetical protein
MEQLKRNIIKTICELEMIFSHSFVDSMEHLPIHLEYKIKVEGLV